MTPAAASPVGGNGTPVAMSQPPSTEVIHAAGTVPWRRRDGILQVALVHRPKYDDWSWPKGKADPGELLPVTAVRETFEETGLRVCLGRPLSPTAYTVLDKRGAVARKQVAYCCLLYTSP